MSHVKPLASVTDVARPPALLPLSMSCQFVYPSSLRRYAAHKPVGPAPTIKMRGSSRSGGEVSVSAVYAGPA